MRSSFRALQLVCGLLALGPIAVVGVTACGNSQPPRAVMEPSAEDSSALAPKATPTVAASTSASAPEPGVALAASPGDDAGKTTPVDLPPKKLVDVEPPCARSAGAFIDSHRACTTDSECSIAAACAPIGPCAFGIRRDAEPGFREKHDAAMKACKSAKVPTPCASCALHPQPRCGTGFCRP